MPKVLLISGSNRKGNTEYILKKIQERIKESQLILLKNKHIDFCYGCLACHQKPTCVIKDDMLEVINQMLIADIIVFGIPNYFDNVTGLFKNFIDRLHPLYKSKQLKNKKVVFIYVGGGKKSGTKESLHQGISGMLKYLELDLKQEYSIQALNGNDAQNLTSEINEIITGIKMI